jgi:hypothetical protein
MPLGVALSELRYELRAEIYSSLLPAHGLSAVDMQNALLERTQRELWNLYAWPHLAYHVDFDIPANTQFVDFDATMPFENVVSLWRNYDPSNQQPWIQLRYGFEDSINELLASYPPTRWRNRVTVDTISGLTQFNGQAQIWPIPTQLSHMRWHGQAPLNPLKLDTDQCMIDSTAIVLTCAAELLGSQKSEVASLKGNKAQAYIRRLLGRSGANKRDISAMGQGRTMQPTYQSGATPYLDYIPGP